MNKFLFSAVISAILTSGAFSADLLASLTNGKISDNSPSVKVLSLDEAKQVKGEYNIATLENINTINLAGGTTIKEAYAVINLAQVEIDNKALCTFGATKCSGSLTLNKNRYNDFAKIADPKKNEVVVITGTMTTAPAYYGLSKSQFFISASVYVNNGGSLTKLRNINTSNTTVKDAMSRIRNDLNQKLVLSK
ncbi:hypothetical protein [Campylobacter sp.]|uniref:hypothetical protein n=1 Tax=Campylobacter sp. TaxID=205 RepID=UPI002A827A92|nr:hypothetical protein [Campylobacter sp.]MDY4154591.1 hypothetical protein [Campylobacter sp.]